MVYFLFVGLLVAGNTNAFAACIHFSSSIFSCFHSCRTQRAKQNQMKWAKLQQAAQIQKHDKRYYLHYSVRQSDDRKRWTAKWLLSSAVVLSISTTRAPLLHIGIVQWVRTLYFAAIINWFAGTNNCTVYTRKRLNKQRVIDARNTQKQKTKNGLYVVPTCVVVQQIRKKRNERTNGRMRKNSLKTTSKF